MVGEGCAGVQETSQVFRMPSLGLCKLNRESREAGVLGLLLSWRPAWEKQAALLCSPLYSEVIPA